MAESSRTRSPGRIIVTVLMDLLVVIAVALVVHLVILFFGQISAQAWAKSIAGLTGHLALPLGIDPIRTPYAGTFDVNAALTVLVLLAGEWVLGTVRRTV